MVHLKKIGGVLVIADRSILLFSRIGWIVNKAAL
jgi:hypothetical protein